MRTGKVIYVQDKHESNESISTNTQAYAPEIKQVIDSATKCTKNIFDFLYPVPMKA